MYVSVGDFIFLSSCGSAAAIIKAAAAVGQIAPRLNVYNGYYKLEYAETVLTYALPK